MSCSQKISTLRRILLVLMSAFPLLTVPDAQADGWQSRAPVPGPRAAHTIVWTGSEAIVWGGGVDGSFLNTGARYSPSTDAWQMTTSYGAPAARWFHAAVWTGSEMIVWGGRANFFPSDHFNDGARYSPTTDTWTPISTYGAPTPRSQCAAVWTGEELVVWGGETDGGTMLADGAAYNPTTDSWRPIGNSGLAARMEPTAVWTGSEMIVFGGVDATKPGWLSYGDGARYNPFTDSWTPLPSGGAPGSRTGHTAVWTGERMIIWGGRELPSDARLNDGASYHPGSDTWASLSPYGAPQARALHAAVWTGNEMIVWGGDAGSLLDTGARYNLATALWTSMTQANAPRQRMFWRPDHGVWTGRGMLVCAGSDYPASLDSTALYTVFELPCPPVIVEQPQSVTVTEGQSVALAVGARGCVQDEAPTATRNSIVPDSERFEFETGARSGQLLLDLEFYTVPDSIHIYYEGQLIFDTTSTGYGQFLISYGPGSATSVEIIVNEESGSSPVSVWEYTVRYRPPQVSFQWHKHGDVLEGQTNEMLRFESVELEDAGDYSVRVSGNGGSVLSAVAKVTVETIASTNCVTVPADLVAWWSAEGNSNDRSGTNQGVLSGGVSYASGKVGSAFVFSNDSEGAVKFAASPSLDVGTGDGFTVEGWIRRTSPTASGPIVEWSDGSRWGSHFWVLNDVLYANLTSPGGGWHAVVSSTPVPVGVWNHVALSYEKGSGTGRLYLNGTKVGESAVGSFSPETGFDFYLGHRPAPEIYRDSFEGLLDEFSLYGRTLSSVEIAAIHSAGALGKCVPPTPSECLPAGLVAWWRGDGGAADVTGAHDGELLYGTTFVTGVSGQAFHFDLSRARVSIPDSDAFKLTNSLSFEGWINVSSYAPGIVFIRGDNRGGLDPYHMSVKPSGRLHWGINAADNNFAFVQSPNPVPTGGWMHVAAVLDGATGNMSLYINGSLASQTNTTLRPLRDLDPSWEPAVGIGNAGGTFHHFPFHGSVDEWALYSRALGAAEILALYNRMGAEKCSHNPPPSTNHVFNLSDDFWLGANPNGPWSYGRVSGGLNGAFELLNTTKSFPSENAVPIDAWFLNDAKPFVAQVVGPGTAVSYLFNAPAGTVYFGANPDAVPNDFASIRFTVPAGGAGLYRLNTRVQALYDGTRSADSDFHVLRNGGELFARLVPPNGSGSYSNVLMLAAGDRIDFVSGRGGGLPDTGLKIEATLELVEPDTMSVVAVEFMSVCGTRVTGCAPRGTICRVERSTDLKTWSYVGRPAESGNGVFELIDLQPPDSSVCFYRMLRSR